MQNMFGSNWNSLASKSFKELQRAQQQFHWYPTPVSMEHYRQLMLTEFTLEGSEFHRCIYQHHVVYQRLQWDLVKETLDCRLVIMEVILQHVIINHNAPFLPACLCTAALVCMEDQLVRICHIYYRFFKRLCLRTCTLPGCTHGCD